MRLKGSISTLALALACSWGILGSAPSRGAEAQYPETKELIGLVTRAAELFERRGQAACDTFKQQDSEWLHDEVYVFVVDFEGKAR